MQATFSGRRVQPDYKQINLSIWPMPTVEIVWRPGQPYSGLAISNKQEASFEHAHSWRLRPPISSTSHVSIGTGSGLMLGGKKHLSLNNLCFNIKILWNELPRHKGHVCVKNKQNSPVNFLVRAEFLTTRPPLVITLLHSRNGWGVRMTPKKVHTQI